MISYPKRLSTIYKDFIKSKEEAGIEIEPKVKEAMIKHIESKKQEKVAVREAIPQKALTKKDIKWT
jgi:hypothetical protein